MMEQQDSRAVVRWEYRTVHGRSPMDYLNELGCEGWELVGTTTDEIEIRNGSNTHYPSLVWILKRPIPAWLEVKVNVPPEPSNLKLPSSRAMRDQRWVELRARESAGMVTRVRTAVLYELTVHDVIVANYVSDFEYDVPETGLHVVEDVKRPEERGELDFIKLRLMKICHDIDVYKLPATKSS